MASLAPFSVPSKLHRWVPGAVATAALMAGSVWGALRRRGLLRALAAMVAGCCAWLLLALAASWPDRATGVLGKLYRYCWRIRRSRTLAGNSARIMVPDWTKIGLLTYQTQPQCRV